MLIFLSFVYADESPYPGQFNWDDYFSEYSEVLGWAPLEFSYNEPTQLNWYPIADWEIETCSQDFSTDFEIDDSNIAEGYTSITADDTVYGLTIALNPELKNTSFTSENEEKEYLFSMGWYIAGLPSGGSNSATIKYKISLGSGSNYLDLGGGETEKEFSIITGTSGFYSNYTTDCFDNIRLIIEGDTRKVITQDVVFLDEDGNSVNDDNDFCNND